MNFISLFSGIGGFDLGFERAGMTCILQVEKDKHALSQLKKHWPDIKKIEDVKDVSRKSITKTVDLICGGSPCQDVSVAGKRAGLAGNRSGLWFEFLRIIEEIHPEWVVFENVPGLLSSNKGRDMGTVIGGLAKCGYWWAYRVLDSQYFGVPQRRRRVFIVASLTTKRAAKVLFEPESRTGGFEESKRKQCDIARGIKNSPGRNFLSFYLGDSNISIDSNISPTSRASQSGNKVSITTYDRQSYAKYVAGTVASTVSASDYKRPSDLVKIEPVVWEMSHANESVRISKEIFPTLQKRMGTGGNQTPIIGVRRLMPLEAERLQGFPDDWTAGQSDTQRYKQIGNAVTVNVLEWIGERIMMVENGEL